MPAHELEGINYLSIGLLSESLQNKVNVACVQHRFFKINTLTVLVYV